MKAIRDLVKEGGLVIFDGLDEVLVHLTTQQGQQFTRQLLGLVPPGSPRGRLLLTCRTHYFRTFKEQASHFRLEGRDNIKGEDYRARLLLPFNEQQIRAYLKNSFPENDTEAIWRFIQSVHNLPESERCLQIRHSSFVNGCVWSPDGRHVLSASADGSLRIFDAQTGTECGMQCWHLKPPRNESSWASVDPETKRVLKYGEDAWRSVGYVVPDETGMPLWVPVEAVDAAG